MAYFSLHTSEELNLAVAKGQGYIVHAVHQHFPLIAICGRNPKYGWEASIASNAFLTCKRCRQRSYKISGTQE